MPSSANARHDTWNSFQREHKGKWNKDELSRQWKLYKEQQAASPNEQQHAASQKSSSDQLVALKAGIKTLIHSTRKDAGAAVSAAVDASAGADQAGGGCQTQPHEECASSRAKDTQAAHAGAPAQAAAATASDTATDNLQVGQPSLDCAPCTPRNTCCRPSQGCGLDASMAAAASLEAGRGTAMLADDDGEDAASSHGGTPLACADNRQLQGTAGTAVTPESSTSGSGAKHRRVPAQELAKLRVAVHQLLAKQAPQQLLAQHQLHQQQQQHGQQLPPPCFAPAEHLSVSSGCFGRSWGASKLSWNAFQKACKGRGLTKPEISAAYAAAKLQLQQSGQHLDLDSYIQQQRDQAGTWQPPPTEADDVRQPAPHSKWSTLHHWLSSKVSSQVASRTVSRAGSAAVSPSSSPAHNMPPQQQCRSQGQCDGSIHMQQQLAAAGGGGGGGKWGAFKVWLHSRGSSRAASRLNTPAASPGNRHDTDTGKQRCSPQEQQLQQQKQACREQAATEAHLLPFAQLMQDPSGQQEPQQHQVAAVSEPLQPWLCQPGSQQPPLPGPQQQGPLCQQPSRAGGTEERFEAICSSSHPAAVQHHTVCGSQSCPNSSLCAVGSSSAIRLHSGITCTAAIAAAAAADPPLPGVAAQSAAPTAAAPAAGGGGVKVHGRLARETVADDEPGLLDGFSPWVLVEPQHLKRLKRAVPARPGLYEWGVQLPICHMPGSSCSAGVVDGGQQSKQLSPVLAFYLGKAGTLHPQRPRRSSSSSSQYSSTGETLRSRLNKYCLTKAGQLGPKAEPHKAAIFAQQLRAGGRLHYRWRVLTDIEPVEAETQLLKRLDYAANFMQNNSRRAIILPPLHT